ncbi:MAG: sigma 54-interacting transcriptional regulator [Syntrophales bacterium]|nr:sigma 54-interacting transcriptional regulator [Syntrophales bacterium]
MQDKFKMNHLNAKFRWQDLCDEFFLVNVLESIHDAVVVAAVDGTIVYVNPAYERELNVGFHRIVGRKMQEVAPEALILKVLKDGQPIIDQPSRILGVGIDIIASCTPIYKNDVLIGATTVFKNVSEIKHMSEELERLHHFNDYLQEQLDLKRNFPREFNNIIGNNKVFRDMLSRAIKASQSDITVLLRGDTGTGKDLVAKAIHTSSRRKRRPFLGVNCAAIPENLLESELFGYEEGAFTGARKGGKPGKFELANGGTLFLDEIGDMNPVLQTKLLRILQEKEFERVGGTKRIQTDVRIITATHQSLESKIKENEFRADLFYRLNVFSIKIIPLSERRDDIPLLSAYFLKKFSEKEEKVVKLSSSVMKLFINYCWPGNVRELQNVIESAVVSCEHEYIEIEDLPDYLRSIETVSEPTIDAVLPALASPDDSMNLGVHVSSLERERIIQAIEKAGKNRTQAIQMLGISRSAFYKKLAKYGIN